MHGWTGFTCSKKKKTKTTTTEEMQERVHRGKKKTFIVDVSQRKRSQKKGKRGPNPEARKSVRLAEPGVRLPSDGKESPLSFPGGRKRSQQTLGEVPNPKRGGGLETVELERPKGPVCKVLSEKEVGMPAAPKKGKGTSTLATLEGGRGGKREVLKGGFPMANQEGNAATSLQSGVRKTFLKGGKGLFLCKKKRTAKDRSSHLERGPAGVNQKIECLKEGGKTISFCQGRQQGLGNGQGGKEKKRP